MGAGSLAGAYEARLEAIIAGLQAGQPAATAGGLARTPALGNRNSLRASSEPGQRFLGRRALEAQALRLCPGMGPFTTFIQLSTDFRIFQYIRLTFKRQTTTGHTPRIPVP